MYLVLASHEQLRSQGTVKINLAEYRLILANSALRVIKVNDDDLWILNEVRATPVWLISITGLGDVLK